MSLLAGSALAQTAPSPSPAQPPAAQAPAEPAPSAATPQRKPGDAFGQEVTITEKDIVYFSGSGMWDSAFETIVEGFKTVNAYMEKQGLKPAGLPMTIYTGTDDSGFQFQAAVPVAAPPSPAPQGDIKSGKSPGGRALTFVHRGSYDAMDTTYEAITNYLDEKRLEAKDLFVEEYQTDPVMTAEDDLVITVFVPVR
jgi:effector-binding domain-containing protein